MLRVADCIRNSVSIAIPEPTEQQRIGDQIDAAFITAGAGRQARLISELFGWEEAVQPALSSRLYLLDGGKQAS